MEFNSVQEAYQTFKNEMFTDNEALFNASKNYLIEHNIYDSIVEQFANELSINDFDFEFD